MPLKNSSAIISGVHPESAPDQESSSDSDEQLHMLNFRRKKPGEASIYRICLAKRHGSGGRAINYGILSSNSGNLVPLSCDTRNLVVRVHKNNPFLNLGCSVRARLFSSRAFYEYRATKKPNPFVLLFCFLPCPTFITKSNYVKL